MDPVSILNIVANSVICLAMTAFFVLLFGNGNSIIYKWPILQHWSLKIALVSIISTSAWNAMNVLYFHMVPRHGMIVATVNTPIGEILMNVGLASLFVWIVIFHKYHFLSKAPPKKITKTAKKKVTKKRQPVR
jgi:hypothetical protein